MSYKDADGQLWGEFRVPEGGRKRFISEYSPAYVHRKAMRDLEAHPDFPAQMAAIKEACHTPTLTLHWGPSRYAVKLCDSALPPSYQPGDVRYVERRAKLRHNHSGRVDWEYYDANPWEHPLPEQRLTGAIRNIEYMYHTGEEITEGSLKSAASRYRVPLKAMRERYAYWLQEQERINTRRVADGKNPSPPLPDPELALIR